MKIIANNVPRKLKYGYEMPEKYRSDFDYIAEDEFDFHDFIEYKGQWIDFSETMVCPNSDDFAGWHSYISDSFFSGLLFKLVDSETVVVGRYFS